MSDSHSAPKVIVGFLCHVEALIDGCGGGEVRITGLRRLDRARAGRDQGHGGARYGADRVEVVEAKLTASPDDAVALTVNGAVPYA